MHNTAVLPALLRQLNWPLVVLIVALVAILVFRRPIERLIDRTNRIRVPGLGIQTVSQSGSVQGAKNDPSHAAEELRRTLDNQLVVQQGKLISDDLDKRGIAGADRDALLIRFVALVSLAWQFEMAYTTIWGSQLALLNHLNPRAPVGVSVQEAKQFFDGAALLYPQTYSGISIEQWLASLQNNVLILRNGNQINITVKRREFLKYLVERGYPAFKVG